MQQLLSCLQLPHRRVTFSAASQAQDLQDPSQHSYYDSGLEESETPSSKSSSGPRIGPLALPEDHYERTTPDGSIGEMEHPENGTCPPPAPVPSPGTCARGSRSFMIHVPGVGDVELGWDRLATLGLVGMGGWRRSEAQSKRAARTWWGGERWVREGRSG